MVHINTAQASAPKSQDAAESASPKYTPTPWRVFINDDGTKLVGIGSGEGQGILDCGFGVWAWDDAEGIANANLVVKAVNSHDALVKALQAVIDAACDYLPPDGISKDDFINRVLLATDNSKFNAAFTAAAC
jgi:hypothetical protein